MAKRKLIVEILGDSKSLERAFSRSAKSARRFNVGVGTLLKSAVVFRAANEAMTALGNAVGGSISEFASQQKVAAQTNAVLKSTAGIANVSAKRVDQLAASIQNYSGIDDEAVKAGENLLLTFKNVRNEAGKGNAVFDRASKSAVDLSVAGFGSLSSTSKQLGKALNDPIKGMTALGRAGVTFTAGQKKTIKALVENNRLLDAQKLILKEVESQVGGSARAFGQTIPGALARTSEAFKNMGGAIVGAVAPAVAEVANLIAGVLPKIEARVTSFVGHLKEAGSFSAKVDVVIETVGDLATQLTQTVGDAVSRVDWDAVWAEARGIADGFQKRLEEIDFGLVGQRIGDGIAIATKRAIPAAKELAARISDAAAAIDFVKIGKAAGPGLAAAVVSAFVTLLDASFWIKNWDLALAVAATVFRVRIVAVIGKLVAPLARLGGDIVLRIGVGMLDAMPRLGGILISGLARLPALAARALSPLTRLVSRVFGRLGKLARFVVTVLGIQAAVNAVVGFAKKVGRVFENLGNTIGSALDRAFEFLKRRAIKAALAIIEPFTHIPGFLGGGAFQDLKRQWQGTLDAMETSTKTSAAVIQRAIDSIHGKSVAITVAASSRPAGESGRGEDVGAVTAARELADRQKAAAEAIKKARQAAAAAAKRAAAAAAKALEKSREAFAVLMDSLSLASERAQETKGFKDDLKVLRQQEGAIREQIKIEGRTTDLERQLFQIRQERKGIREAIRQQAREARQGSQFKALGLTAAGETRVASTAALAKRLGTLREQVRGTFLDTSKTRSQLQRIAKVLSGQFGKVGKDVRAAIQQMFADISGSLGGTKTKSQKANVDKMLRGLGLAPEQLKELRARFSQIGAGGTIPSGGVGAFGFAMTGGGGGVRPFRESGGIVIENMTVVANNPEELQKQLQRKARRRAASRRGVRAGHNSGLG